MAAKIAANMAAKIAAKIVFLPAIIQTFRQIDAYFKAISF